MSTYLNDELEQCDEEYEVAEDGFTFLEIPGKYIGRPISLQFKNLTTAKGDWHILEMLIQTDKGTIQKTWTIAPEYIKFLKWDLGKFDIKFKKLSEELPTLVKSGKLLKYNVLVEIKQKGDFVNKYIRSATPMVNEQENYSVDPF